MSRFVSTHKRALALLLIATSLLVAAACGGEEVPTPTPITFPPTPTPITLPPTPTPVVIPTIPSVEPALVISPSGVLEEGSITVNGSGFGSGEQVSLQVKGAGSGGSNVSLGNATANASGAFSQTFGLPSSVGVGVWTVRAEGNAGSKATAPIIVLKAPK